MHVLQDSWFPKNLLYTGTALHSAYKPSTNVSNSASRMSLLQISSSWPSAIQQLNKPNTRNRASPLINLALTKNLSPPPCLLLSLIPHLPAITQLSSKLLLSSSVVIPKCADQQKQCFLSLLVQFWGGCLLHFGFWYYKADPGAEARITFGMCHQNKSYNFLNAIRL